MAVDDDIEIEWTPLGARFIRPLTVGAIRSGIWASAWLFLFAGLASAPIGFEFVRPDGVSHPGLIAAIAVFVCATGLGLFGLAHWLPADRYASIAPGVVVGGFASATLLVPLAFGLVGPKLGVTACYGAATPLLAFLFLRRSAAILTVAAMLTGFGVALTLMDGVLVPGIQLTYILASAVASGVLLGSVATRFDEARQSEAHAKAALAAVNRRLRRFLAPQVADALTTSAEQLEPHRREIAACFVDLRGFTSFTNVVSPERVVEVLAEYYQTVGTIIDSCGGTIGGFDGDGIFAFLGDPTPNKHAAADALVMAKQIATALDGHTKEWGLGYGIGLTYGEATVGLVGFEGRLDYTPVGACVNLAARLCSDAKPAEIVIDDALRVEANVAKATRRDAVDFKGFGEVASFTVSH